ncbi:CAP domain-containing protein [Pedobacter metabolipauper]|nr:CAP domain-containing protein [Pedobacter metabolipauper]
MKLVSVALLFMMPLLVSFAGKKQDTAYTWSKEELKFANTAGNASYLTGEEKDMVLYMNLARMDGEKFFNTYFQDFIDQHNKQMVKYSNYNEIRVSRTDSYYRSLEKELKAIKGLPVLWPDEALSWVSKQHAKDMNKNNYAAHNSLDGRTVKDRIGKMYPKRSFGENLAFGFQTGLGNVSMLLLDKGVPDLGHRKIILNTAFKLNYVGVSIQPHKGYKYCSVTDFVALPGQ